MALRCVDLEKAFDTVPMGDFGNREDESVKSTH